MCGIGGWLAFGDKRPQENAILDGLGSLVSRGTDASGAAWALEWGGGAGYIKAALPGTKLFEKALAGEDKFSANLLAQIRRSRICIMHTRAATKGSPDNIHNNHPVLRKEGRYVLVHNGIVHNDDAIFDQADTPKRQAQVDTEALVALMDKKEDILAAREELTIANGSYAIAAMNRTKVDSLLFVRRSSPLELILDTENDILFFASTREAAVIMFGKDRILGGEWRGLPIVGTTPGFALKDDWFMLLGPNGVLASDKHSVDFSRAPSRYITNRGGTQHPFVHQNQTQRTGQTWEKAGTGGTKSIEKEKKVKNLFPIGFHAARVCTWHHHTLTLFSAEGMYAPLGDVDGASTFKSFPILKDDTPPDLLVQCPACWEKVNAQKVAKIWRCPNPNCDEHLIANVFRELSSWEKEHKFAHTQRTHMSSEPQLMY